MGMRTEVPKPNSLLLISAPTMPDHKYQLRISRLPEIDILLKRVNVFLGTNGTGKSKLLQEVKGKSQIFGDKPVIYVEGGRTIQMIDSLRLDGNTFSAFEVTSAPWKKPTQ